jgi:TRAP-type C4-dicarboxylate transport system permease small subunit
MKRGYFWMVFDRIIRFFAVVAGVLLLLITLFVSYSVILRYSGLRPPIWILQFTEYGLLWITFLAAAWLLRHEKHIRIDTLVMRFGPKTRQIFNVIVSVLGIAVSFVIFWFGTQKTLDLHARQIMDVKGVIVPLYPLFLIIPLGGLMLLIQFLRNFLELLKTRQGSEPRGPEPRRSEEA